MWLSILSALVCFAVATILFTPPLRSFPFYLGFSIYFLFEGAWTLLNAVALLIWPYSNFMVWVHYVGAILFAGYLLYSLYLYTVEALRAQPGDKKGKPRKYRGKRHGCGRQARPYPKVGRPGAAAKVQEQKHQDKQ